MQRALRVAQEELAQQAQQEAAKLMQILFSVIARQHKHLLRQALSKMLRLIIADNLMGGLILIRELLLPILFAHRQESI